MKTNQSNIGKLQLKKNVIANLTQSEQNHLLGGLNEEAAKTTSFGKCTGFLCCDKTESIQITIDIISKTLK